MATTTTTLTVMDCPICEGRYKQPKILPCGHLTCRDCLVARLQANLTPSCPVCPADITSQGTGFQGTSCKGTSFQGTSCKGTGFQGTSCKGTSYQGTGSQGTGYQVIADGFPTDLTMVAWVEADRLLSQQHRCCVCADKMAEDVCLNCSDMFCASCSLVHTKQSATRLHKMQSLRSTTAEALAANRPAPCDVHREEDSKLYCPTHDVFVCYLCAAADHRRCPDVINPESKMAEVLKQLSGLTKTVEAGEAALDRAMAQVKDELSDLDTRSKAVLADLDTTLEGLGTALKASRARLKQKVQNKARTARSQVGERQTVLQGRKEKVAPFSAILRRAKGFRTLGPVRNLPSVMKERVRHLDFSTTLPSSQAPKLTLALDPEAVARIKQDLSTLGKSTKQPAAKGHVPVLRFHHKHGGQIKLNESFKTAKRIAEKTAKKGPPVAKGSVVVSTDPMATCMLYQVQINKIDQQNDSTVLGVIAQPPDDITLPETYYKTPPPPSAMVFAHSGVAVFGHLTEKGIPALKDLPAGSKVGLAVHSDRSLHLYVDGKHQGVVAPFVPSPCYFMLDLVSRCTKVTALPVKKIP